MRVRPEPGGEFVGLRSRDHAETLISQSGGRIPARSQRPPHFDISHVLREIGNHAVIHLKMLQLSPSVPVSRAPLDIQPVAAGRQIARLSFSRKEERILAIQIRTVVSRPANAQALANGIAEPSSPVAILVALKNRP